MANNITRRKGIPKGWKPLRAGPTMICGGVEIYDVPALHATAILIIQEETAHDVSMRAFYAAQRDLDIDGMAEIEESIEKLEAKNK